jgi:hypothetical protein
MQKTDQDIDVTEVLRESEKRVLNQGLAQMKALQKQYKQALQKGDHTSAKQLRREYFQEAFINLSFAASPMELLFPDPRLQFLMEKISQELEY